MSAAGTAAEDYPDGRACHGKSDAQVSQIDFLGGGAEQKGDAHQNAEGKQKIFGSF